MAYATGSDLIARFDARQISDLLEDDGTSVSQRDVPTHSVVTTALDDASGKIKGALRKGNRYLPADLSALTGESLALLKRITCDIAMALLLDRRIDADAEQSQKRHERAERYLEQIKSGDIVFDVDDIIEASNAEHIEHTEIDLVTTHKHLLRERTKNYYPARRVPQ